MQWRTPEQPSGREGRCPRTNKASRCWALHWVTTISWPTTRQVACKQQGLLDKIPLAARANYQLRSEDLQPQKNTPGHTMKGCGSVWPPSSAQTWVSAQWQSVSWRHSPCVWVVWVWRAQPAPEDQRIGAMGRLFAHDPRVSS